MVARESAGHPVDLAVQLGPLPLAHPLINASGTLDLLELADTFGEAVLRQPPMAAYVPKTITLEPRAGNPPPRIAETAGGLVNAVGLANEGLAAFLSEKLPRLLELPCPLIVSVGGFSGGEYRELALRLREKLTEAYASPPGPATSGFPWLHRVGLELNISCPNVHTGCMSIGASAAETADVVRAVRSVWPGLLVAKLTPNVADIAAVGRAAVEAGADALAAVNTFKALVIDRDTLRPYLGNLTGGLSGPAVKPLALRAVYELRQAVKVPLIGMGGVGDVQDVLDFLACGASVVAVGSANFKDPFAAGRLAEALGAELSRRATTLRQVVGRAHVTDG